MNLGSWKIDDTVTFTCNTHRSDTGAEADADSVPTYRVYEDETGTPILTGSMAKLDDSNTTGFYSEQITLSAANGLEKGKSYNIRITATVNSVTGSTIRFLQIEAEVDANRINWANVDNPSTTNNLSGTTVKAVTDRVTANTDQISGDAAAADNAESFFDGTGYAGTNNVIPTVTNLTNAPSDSSGITTLLSRLSEARAGYLDLLNSYLDSAVSAIKSVVDAIKLKTDNLSNDPADASDIAAAFSSLSSQLATRASQTSVDDLPTNAELATALAGADDTVLAAISGLNNLSQENVRSAVGLASANLDIQLSNIQTSVDDIPTNPLLDNDARLDNLDAEISSRLAAVAYTTPDNVGIESIENVIAGLDIPTTNDILAAAEENPIHANIMEVNNTGVTGTGTVDSDPWRKA